MTFPLLELKFSSLKWADDSTTITVRAYRVNDGGLDANGNQQFSRVLRRQRTFVVPGYHTLPQIVTFARARLLEWNAEFGFNLTEDRLICSL